MGGGVGGGVAQRGVVAGGVAFPRADLGVGVRELLDLEDPGLHSLSDGSSDAVWRKSFGCPADPGRLICERSGRRMATEVPKVNSPSSQKLSDLCLSKSSEKVGHWASDGESAFAGSTAAAGAALPTSIRGLASAASSGGNSTPRWGSRGSGTG